MHDKSTYLYELVDIRKRMLDVPFDARPQAAGNMPRACTRAIEVVAASPGVFVTI
jgi:hypothetical protein